MTDNSTRTAKATKKKPIRRIRRRAQAPEYTPSSELLKIIAQTLPVDYEFEIPKTIWRIRSLKAKNVCLQMPEGLLMYATVIGDILKRFVYEGEEKSAPLVISVLGDVTYGACCIDDLGAKALGSDLIVHYGHSCLVPMTSTVIPCLYIFVEISIDFKHFVDCVCASIPEGTHCELMGTVQVSVNHLFTILH
jgi:2-(3-amino-3-carboxypropyl)histidine synthase